MIYTPIKKTKPHLLKMGLNNYGITSLILQSILFVWVIILAAMTYKQAVNPLKIYALLTLFVYTAVFATAIVSTMYTDDKSLDDIANVIQTQPNRLR
jgi:glucan phosphoethanolaminetransferase (alkaline phosphatase superfamily)